MRRIPIVLLLMFGMVVGGSQAVPAASDHFIVLDPYDPRGINNRGEIVGGYTDAHGLHGFVRSQGTVTLFDGPVGACVPFPNAPDDALPSPHCGHEPGSVTVCDHTRPADRLLRFQA